MWRRVACLLLLVVPVPAAVLAHADFDEDDGLYEHEHPAELTEQDSEAAIVVPGDTEPVREVEFNQAPAVQNAPSLFGQPAALLSQTGLPPGTSELPFVLLSVGLDADQDGLSNNDERLLGTDMQRADSDGDGYIDGLEIVRGYNPLVPGPGDKVSYAVQPDPAAQAIYIVTGVRLEGRGSSSTSSGTSGGQELLVVTGMAPENALVFLRVASEHERTWVARADDSGRFLYTSADTLEMGEHTVRAAAPAADGRLAAGEPFTFQRTAAGVELPPSPAPAAPENPALRWLLPAILVLGVLAVLGAMLLFVRRAGQLRRARAAQAKLHQQLQQTPPDS